jgi:hypothetical protein
MALDRLGLEMIAGFIKGARILCLGYPDITAEADEVERLLKVRPQKFTDHGADHGVSHRLPETINTFRLAGAVSVECVDVRVIRGMERVVDLNERQSWIGYDLVINPGTVEHCFDVAAAMFNAWRAVDVGGVVLHVAPMTMLNHGFWNVCPTALADFAAANGGRILEMKARDREWKDVPVERVKRFRAPPESVLYATVHKADLIPERIPTQWRFG